MDTEGTHVHHSKRLSKHGRMDVSLCERLPEHVVEKIVFRLPIRDISRVRAVCHGLNSLVNCPGFALRRAREGVPSEGPWFFVLTMTDDAVKEVTEIAAYYPSVNEWKWIRQPTTNMLDGFSYASSDGGLICYYDFWERIVVVVNPLTKAYRRLPRGPMKIFVDSMCLVVDRATRSYQVILIARCEDEITPPNEGFNVVVEAYHSSSDSWYRMGNKSPPLSIPGRVHPTRPLHASGCLYMFCKPSSELLVFSLDEHVWRRIAVPFLRSVDGEHAVQWQERLFIIADKEDFNDDGFLNWPLTEGIFVWELCRASSSWVLVDGMPDCIFQQFAHRDEEQRARLMVTSVADCSLVLLTAAVFNRDSSPAMSVKSLKTVLYDLEKQAWTMVKGCPLQGVHGMNVLENVGYEPRLDAMV